MLGDDQRFDPATTTANGGQILMLYILEMQQAATGGKDDVLPFVRRLAVVQVDEADPRVQEIERRTRLGCASTGRTDSSTTSVVILRA
ncbi:MAG TPA: hypothetical protein VMP11_11955 [Verrucomicrobiae bacterium]|nr:hypothetical protein [Verrucomicrobiae bacterium]